MICVVGVVSVVFWVVVVVVVVVVVGVFVFFGVVVVVVVGVGVVVIVVGWCCCYYCRLLLSVLLTLPSSLLVLWTVGSVLFLAISLLGGKHLFVSDFAQVAWANRKMSRKEMTITEDCSIVPNVKAWVANDFCSQGWR